MTSRTARVGDIATGLLMLIALWLVGRALLDTDTPPTPEPVAEGVWNAWLAEAHRFGAVDAPVGVVVFSTYTCGYCARLKTSLDTLIAQRGADVVVAYKHMVHGADQVGYMLALGAECAADQGKFPEFHSAAFGARRIAAQSDVVPLAAAAGVADTAMFSRCMSEDKYGERIRNDRAAVEHL